MVRYVSGITAAMGLIDARSGRLTRLGEVLSDVDPYLSAPFVPWIVHYNLASNPRHVVWHRVVNELVYSQRRFGLEDAKMLFVDLQETHAAGTVMTHVVKELAALLETYTVGALSRLSYLDRENKDYRAPSTMRVPPLAFGYSILAFASRYRQGETAIAIGDIAAAPSSPGRIFLMREPDVRAHLERMHRDGVVSIENKGHLDQVRFADIPDPADYLLAHYEDTED